MATTAADLEIRFSSNTRNAEAGIDRMGSKVKGLGSMMQTALGTGLGFLGAGAFNAMIGSVGELVKGALDFEAGMANVNSIAQLTGGELKSLSADVNALASETAQAPQVLAAGLYDIYSSGFQGAEALKVLTASANAATAGLTTTDVSARAITAVMNAYGQETYSAAQISDILFQTVNDGVITFDQLANNMGNTLPMANALGISFEELAAAYAQMTLQGVNASAAETQIAALMKSAANPTDALTQATKDYGYENTQALIAAEGFEGILKAVYKAADGDQSVMYDLLGTQEAVNAAMILGQDDAAGYTEELDKMKKSAGATDKALAKQMQSASFRMKQAKIAVQQAATAFIGMLAPGIAAVAQGFTWLVLNGLIPAVDWFGRVLDPIQRFAGLLGEVMGEGMGVDDLMNVLFGPGAEFRDAPEIVQDAAHAMLVLADTVGDLWSAFQTGGFSGLIDQFGEEMETLKGALSELADIAVEVVIDTAVSIIGDIKTLAEKGWQAFVEYAGYGGAPIDATGGSEPLPFDTIDVLIDGAVRLMGDLSDLGGAIDRELGLQVTESELESARKSGEDTGKSMAESVIKGIGDGIAAADTSGDSGGGDGVWGTIKKILVWEPPFARDDQPTFIDEAVAWANGVGAGMREAILEGITDGLNGAEVTSGVGAGSHVERPGGLDDWLNETADLILTSITEIPGEVMDGVAVMWDDWSGEDLLPVWLQTDWSWITGPIETLRGYIDELFGLIGDAVNAKQTSSATQNQSNTVGGGMGLNLIPRSVLAGYQNTPATDVLPIDTPPQEGIKQFVTIDADDKPFFAKFDNVQTQLENLGNETHKATFDIDTGPAAIRFTDAFTWGQTWEDALFSAAFDIDHGPAAIKYTEAFGWGETWAAQTFTASFSVDTSGLLAAVDVARSVAQQISDLMPHSPAKTGPLARPISFGYIADELAASMDRMGPLAERGMGALASKMSNRVGMGGVYGGDGAQGGAGGGISLTVPVTVTGNVYGVDDLEGTIVDTFTGKLVPALEVAIKRRDRANGLQP